MSTLVSGRNYNIHLDGKTIEFGPNRSQGGAIEGIRFARKNLFLDDLALIKRCVRQFLQPSNDSALITLTNEPFLIAQVVMSSQKDYILTTCTCRSVL